MAPMLSQPPCCPPSCSSSLQLEAWHAVVGLVVLGIAVTVLLTIHWGCSPGLNVGRAGVGRGVESG